MPTAVLLNHEDPAFAFEHAMAHRNVMRVMYPLSRFSAMPYFVDPEIMTDQNASSYHLDHQQAHNDAFSALAPYGSVTPVSHFVRPNLADTNLADQEKLSWWKHHNHMAHYTAEQTVVPDPRYRFPFW